VTEGTIVLQRSFNFTKLFECVIWQYMLNLNKGLGKAREGGPRPRQGYGRGW